jgi:hypothetical protein
MKNELAKRKKVSGIVERCAMASTDVPEWVRFLLYGNRKKRKKK